MSNSNTFNRNLQVLRNRVKQRRKQEMYDMLNEDNQSLEDKIALIKMSLNELDENHLSKSFKSLINSNKKSLKKE